MLTDLLQDGDEVDIATRSNSSTHRVLTRTESYIYHEPEAGSQEAVLIPVSDEETGQAQDTEETQTGETQSEEIREEGSEEENTPEE